MPVIYIVGLIEGGGTWLPQRGYYTSRKDAEDIVKMSSVQGLKVLEIHPGRLATPAHRSKSGYDAASDNSCPGGYIYNDACSRCGASINFPRESSKA